MGHGVRRGAADVRPGRSPRNPYYWKVDPTGQQLPYADYYEVILLGSREILEAKAISGEFNMGGAWTDLASFPLLVENADKAGQCACSPACCGAAV